MNTKQPQVIVYSGTFCPYCAWAIRMLKKKGVEYQEIKVDSDPKEREKMEKLSGRMSVPQIFIGDHHVGGYDDLAALDRNGDLDKLLGLSPP